MLFRCSCLDSHRCMACVDSLAVSMLFDPELTVPDEERAGQVKAREKAKALNPFNIEKERKKRESKEKGERAKPAWNPAIERGEAQVEGSFAEMAAAKKPRRKLDVSPTPWPPPAATYLDHVLVQRGLLNPRLVL